MFKQNSFSYLKKNLETKAFLLFSIFFFIAFQSLSYFSLWVETEIYPVHSSQYLFTEYEIDFLFALKPVFYLILYLSSIFSNFFSLLPMTGARFLFALNGLLILSLMYLYIKKKTNRYNAILAVLILASANIFLDRGFRVRSDLLSSSLSLITLLLTLNIKEWKGYLKFYILIPLLFCLLLISPKGIYWFCFTLCLMLYDLKNKTPSRWIIVKIVFAVYMVFYFLSFLFKDPFFLKTIYQSAKFYLSNISMTWQFIFEKGWIKNLSDFSHISLFIERNLLLFMLIFVKFLFVIYSIVITNKRKWDLSDLYFLFLLIVLLFHPQQKLFFLCAVMPFIFISFFTDWQWRQLVSDKYSLQFKTLLLAGALLYSFSYISYFSYRVYMKKSNRPQKELIGELNASYKNTDTLISIFDPACIVYSRKTDCKYILDNSPFPQRFKSYFKKYNFDVVLASRFLDLFTLLNYKQSSFQYINIKNHVYYKALMVDLTNKNNLLETAEFNNDIPVANKNSWNSEDKARKLQKDIPFLDTKFLQEKPFKGNFLSGDKLLRFLLSSLKTKVPEHSRKYSYLFLDSQNKAIKKSIDCHKKEETPLILQNGCPYSKKEFASGLIPIEKEKLALFYLSLPLGISEELSLRALFRYDLY